MRLQGLGTSGLLVSRVGLGCNNFGTRIDLEQTRAVVEAALEEGITFFDTADVYGNGGGSERFLGEVLKGRRGQVVLATKFGGDMGDGREPRGSRRYVRRAIEASLERLQTDHVDLYYYHRPDGVTPLAETLGALHELVEEGKVRHAGCSNFRVGQLDEAEEVGRADETGHFVALQNEYSLLDRSAEVDVLPRCREYGIGFVPYFPLASGLLSGKYRRGEPPPAGTRLEGREDRLTGETFDRIEALERFAGGHGHSLLELAVGALASEPGVSSVIAGATKPGQVRANALAGDWELTADELEAVRNVG